MTTRFKASAALTRRTGDSSRAVIPVRKCLCENRRCWLFDRGRGAASRGGEAAFWPPSHDGSIEAGRETGSPPQLAAPPGLVKQSSPRVFTQTRKGGG